MVRRHLTILLVALFALASCAETDRCPAPGSDVNPTFTATIEGFDTKASDDSWDANDAIGIYAMNANEAINQAAYSNIQYVTATADGKFTAFDESQAITYPQDGKFDFIAYYPFTTAITDYKYAVDVTDQASQTAIDLLYSNDAKGFDKSTPNVVQTYNHKLTKLYLTIQKGEGVATLDGLTATIGGMNTKASFNLADAVLTVEQSAADIAAKTAAADENVIVEAIVIPETVTEPTIVFQVETKSLLGTLTDRQTLQRAPSTLQHSSYRKMMCQ